MQNKRVVNFIPPQSARDYSEIEVEYDVYESPSIFGIFSKKEEIKKTEIVTFIGGCNIWRDKSNGNRAGSDMEEWLCDREFFYLHCKDKTQSFFNNNEAREYLKDVVGVVQATGYERLCLWRKHRNDWVENSSGMTFVVGILSGRAIVISIFIETVYGCKIAFVDATSILVDWSMIEEWLKVNLPKIAFRNERINMVDAMNFANVTRAKSSVLHSAGDKLTEDQTHFLKNL